MKAIMPYFKKRDLSFVFIFSSLSFKAALNAEQSHFHHGSMNYIVFLHA